MRCDAISHCTQVSAIDFQRSTVNDHIYFTRTSYQRSYRENLKRRKYGMYCTVYTNYCISTAVQHDTLSIRARYLRTYYLICSKLYTAKNLRIYNTPLGLERLLVKPSSWSVQASLSRTALLVQAWSGCWQTCLQSPGASL